jgi:hypothetical protein
MKNKISPQAEAQATKIAKGTQKSGQTKEQTKLIKQGIEKGIAEYKKQQSKKLRELDKQRKQKSKQRETDQNDLSETPEVKSNNQLLPWILLGLSWVGFALYIIW